MKKISFKTKIVLWFTIAISVIVTSAIGIILVISNSVLQKGIRDNLILIVEQNLDEITYFNDLSHVYLKNESDIYIDYQGGVIEIDEDFLKNVNGVYTALYTIDNELIYGENPIALNLYSYKCLHRQLQRINVEKTTYYVYDILLGGEGLDNMYLRGVVSEVAGTTQIHSIITLSLFILPSILIIAIIGGYILTSRFLKPIEKISMAANQIQAGSDLGLRINLAAGDDELYRLAATYDEMLERLEKVFQAEHSFTSNASHELRTPLSVILSQCEYVLEDPMSEEEYIDAIKVIQRQGNKMKELINDMLMFTRLEQASLKHNKQELDFSALVLQICEDMMLISDKNISLKASIDEKLMVNGYKELLERLVTNLISNAYRYGKEHGYIIVELKAEDNDVVLRVEDNGIGMNATTLEHIFQRFYQGDNSHSKIGSGLGLAMVKEISDIHQGEIKVESTLDQGSTFIFKISKI